ncbi:unnamed protein product [Urochloa decumbens]|uniref:BTB domain-containing protein n=1 Tax=Urochloa decumbens TaxID=240449 RepID=A0ABC9AJ98_9POAL
MASEHHLIKIAAPQFFECPTTFGARTPYDSTTSCWSSNIGGYDWQCNYTTHHSSRGTVSLTLLLPHGNIREPLNARFKFSLVDREGRPVLSRTRASSFQNWTTTQHRWEWTCDDIITKDDLEQPEYRLDDGSFTVRFDIALKPFAAKATDAFVTVPPSDLHQHLGNLLECKEGTDVTFQVAGGDMFPAHRCVLAARSPVFRAQLFGEMKESKQTTGGIIIAIEDMEAQVFSSLLRFIYTDSLMEAEEDDDDWPMEHYQHLLVAADRYCLERMKLICQEKLCSHICANSVGRMLALADQHHCPGLKEACFDFLSSSTNLDLFTETDGFEVLSDRCPAVLKELLAKLATVLID